MENVWFSDWQALLRVLLIAPAAYFVLLLFLRVSGKRTLSKMNAFDFIVTIALGSTLATVLLNRQVSLAEGALAFGLLVGLQFLVTWGSVRSNTVQGLVKSEPTLLMHGGEFLDAALRQQRVTREEIRAAVREAGHPDIHDQVAVVLETDGTLSVLGHGRGRSMKGVRRMPDVASDDAEPRASGADDEAHQTRH